MNQGSMFLDSYFRGDQLSPIPFVHRSRPWQFPTIEGLDTILTNLDTLTVRATGAARCARFLPAAKLRGSMDGSPLRDHFRSFLGKCTVSGPPIRSRSKRQLPPFPPLTLRNLPKKVSRSGAQELLEYVISPRRKISWDSES